jgi:hypothetical protein
MVVDKAWMADRGGDTLRAHQPMARTTANVTKGDKKKSRCHFRLGVFHLPWNLLWPMAGFCRWLCMILGCANEISYYPFSPLTARFLASLLHGGLPCFRSPMNQSA